MFETRTDRQGVTFPEPGGVQIPEETAIELARSRDLEAARQALGAGRADAGKRLAATLRLVHLLSSSPGLEVEIEPLLEQLRTDRDPDIAYLADRALAEKILTLFESDLR